MNESCLTLLKASKVDIVYCKDLLKKNKLPFNDINSKNISLYKAYIDNTLIGFAGLEIYGEIALLRSMVIQENYRSKGYGRLIVQEMMKIFNKKNIKEVYLLTTTAPEFFKKLYFEVINREEVPEIIKQTSEFQYLCPQTAVCMKKMISNPEKL